MAIGTFKGGDICIWLSEEEIIELGQLKFEEHKLVNPPLEVLLDTDNNKSLKAILRHIGIDEDAENLRDGIRVDRTDYGFLVVIDYEAYWGIRDNESYGTRYDGENKINFFRD